MKIKKYIEIIIIFLGIFIIANCNKVYAGSQEINNLEYQVQLNSDGSADIIETWNIYIDETNTVFKTFEMDKEKFSNITDVNVSEMNGSKQTSLEQINNLMYHVTKNCYYGLINDDGQFEIAWGVGLDDDSANKIYKISYKVEDIVKTYNDCSEFYWQFLSTNNGISCKNITGNIILPKQVDKLDSLRVWAHGPLNGNIERKSTSEVYFEVAKIPTKTMLETRVVVTDNSLFSDNSNKISANKFESILEEEQKNADDANRLRENAKNRLYVITGLSLILTILLGMLIIKNKNKLSKAKEEFEIKEIQYFREMPNENATPANVQFLLEPQLETNFPNVFSSTFLSLILKGYIEDISEYQNKNLRFRIKEKSTENLRESEKEILVFIQKLNKEEFSMKELKEYIKKHGEKLIKLEEKVLLDTKEEEEKDNNFDEKIKKDYSLKIVGDILLGIIGLAIPIYTISMANDYQASNTITIISIVSMILSIIFAIINVKKSSMINKIYSGITIKGFDELEKWKGLKRYMNDFSLLKEREVPDVVLWEKFLVFATLFGIAEKVIKQLKIYYPNIEQDYTFVNMYMISSMNRDIASSVTSSIVTVQNASSGSGYGGGFSSGGGFGGGGGSMGGR